MSDYCACLISKAFKVIHGTDYNRTLGEYLETMSETGTRQLFYEVVLPQGKPWEFFRDKNYPPFVRYMKNHSISPEEPRGVVVAAFFMDQCYLLDGQEFVNVFSEMEGLDAAGLHSKIGQWLGQ